jgi:hypothetical protein
MYFSLSMFIFQVKTKQTDQTYEVANDLAAREKSAEAEQKPKEVNNTVFTEIFAKLSTD